eukprot:6492795-Amphidinium_carterae.6
MPSELLASIAEARARQQSLAEQAIHNGCQKRDAVLRHGAAAKAEYKRLLSSASSYAEVVTGYCVVHGQQCPLRPQSCSSADSAESLVSKVEVVVAGSSCQPWSRQGQQWGWLDARIIPFMAWLYQMQVQQPSIIIHENSAAFDSELLQWALGGYDVEILSFSAKEVGVPMSRERQWAILRRRRRIVEMAAPFQALCYCTSRMSGHDMFVANEHIVIAEKKEKLRKRGVTIKSGSGTWGDLMTFAERQRLRSYQDARARVGTWPVVNLTQNVHFHSTLSDLIPSLLRGSVLYSFRLTVDNFRPSESQSLGPNCGRRVLCENTSEASNAICNHQHWGNAS